MNFSTRERDDEISLVARYVEERHDSGTDEDRKRRLLGYRVQISAGRILREETGRDFYRETLRNMKDRKRCYAPTDFADVDVKGTAVKRTLAWAVDNLGISVSQQHVANRIGHPDDIIVLQGFEKDGEVALGRWATWREIRELGHPGEGDQWVLGRANAHPPEELIERLKRASNRI